MMKRIVIYQKNDNFPLEFTDDDESNIEDFCHTIEDAFASQTVTTLHFDSASILFRPSLISKIYVQDSTKISDPAGILKQEQLTEKPKGKKIQKIETTEDIITEE